MGTRLIGVLAWLGLFILPLRIDAAEFTAAEKAFLQAHPTINLGVDPDFPPFTHVTSDGSLEGIDKEILDIAAAQLGVTFNLVRTTNWEETLAQARSTNIDVMLSVSSSEERRREFLFTETYVEFPVAIIVRTDAPFSTGLGQLVGRRVAAPRHHITTEVLARDFPGIQLVPCGNISEALDEVLAGRADATMANLAVATYFMNARAMNRLKIGGITGYPFGLRMAVRKDWPLLVSALDKALAGIPESERQAIMDRRIHVDFNSHSTWLQRLGRWWPWLAGVAFIGGAFVLLVLRSNRKLAAINEEKSHLMRMTAHDLKNPLTGLMLNLDLLRSDLQPTHEVVRDVCDRLIPLVQRMNHLVHNLLTVQAIESGRRDLKTEPLSLNDFARATVESIDETAARKLITLDMRLSDVPLMVKADAQSLHEVMDNLVSNALKFSPFSTTIIVRVVKDGKKGRFEVWDQGPGVPKDKMDVLFTKFARLGTKTTGGESSSGLGLSIVKSLVELMHGRIWCESEEGKGAAFIVELPLADGK